MGGTIEFFDPAYDAINKDFAIASFATREPGVYLSMNGGIFTANDVDKNKEIFRFE